MFDSTFWVVLGRVRWREGVFKFSAPAHIFDATQVHRLPETLTFLACAHMSHATYIYAIRWAWTHFLVLALAHVCLADLHVTLVILLVFELANMFDARQSTSSPGNANVPWVRTHVGCYVRYTIPFLLLKQLSLVLCFYTVMWTVCWLRNYMRSPLEAKRMFYFFEPGTSKAISWAGRHTCKKAATLTGPKSVTNFGGVFWFPRNPAYVKKHHFTRVKSKFFWFNIFIHFLHFKKLHDY